MSDPNTHIARRCSPFLDALISRHPDWLDALEDQGRLDKCAPPEAPALAALVAQEGLDAGLRIFRNREMMRIVWRELSGLATLVETMSDLSRLAEICLQAAVQQHRQILQARYGVPRNPGGEEVGLAVLAMGKLGGSELNLSSDIDLVFTFSESGICEGAGRRPAEQFFTRLVQAVVSSLNDITEHGLCFRVDTRLRPFGESGPLVCSFAAMEQYYQREGRDWERYALIKARPVAGDLAGGEELLARLSPFVYRRYLDFGAIEALHEMRTSIMNDSARRDRSNDVKRGPGGIREIEFLVQAFQLIRGGRETALQTPSLLEALHQLELLSVLSPQAAKSLAADYVFLRRLENAIQALHDRQEHRLPENGDLQRVALAMGEPSTDGLLSTLGRVRQRVSRQMDESFPRPEPAPLRELEWAGYKSGQAQPEPGLGAVLQKFLPSLQRLSLSSRAARRLDQFMPRLLESLAGQGFDQATLSDVFDLVLAVCRRSAYIALLEQNPPALQRMLSLFAASGWIAATVIRYPALLDELIDPALGKLLPDRAEMDQAATRILDAHPDAETALLRLNHMKLAFTLRIAVAELETSLTPRAVQASLTALAECMINGCHQLAVESLRARHGSLAGSGMAVIAYGSLGAAELSYRSDLDLIFLYQASDAQSDGARPLAAEPYFTNLARRLLGFLTAPTTSGKLYEVDTRLRPNGRAGLLVSSVSAFEKYQTEEAWTWELQALCRARPCAGEAGLAETFTSIRRNVLTRPRDTEKLCNDIREMRQRLRAAHPGGAAAKHAEGGLIDLDFIAQMGVLVCAAGGPGSAVERGRLAALLDAHGTHDQLQRLVTAHWIPEAQAGVLLRVLDELTRLRHRALLSRQHEPVFEPDPECLAICRSLLQLPPG